MTSSERLEKIIAHTYRESDLAYRLDLLRQFLEWRTYAAHRNTDSTIAQFVAERDISVADQTFLQEFPEDFFSAFQSDQIQADMEALTKESKTLPVLELTVPVLFEQGEVERMGAWARTVIAPNALLEFSVDPGVMAGCQIAWNGQLYDYTMRRYFQKNQAALTQRISELILQPAGASVPAPQAS